MCWARWSLVGQHRSAALVTEYHFMYDLDPIPSPDVTGFAPYHLPSIRGDKNEINCSIKPKKKDKTVTTQPYNKG